MGISIVYAGFVRLLKMLAGIDDLTSVARTSFRDHAFQHRFGDGNHLLISQ